MPTPTEQQLIAAFEGLAQDVIELHAFNVALVEKLMERKHNLGAVRALEPLLRKEDVDAITKRQGEVLKQILDDRTKKMREAASALVLPPGAKE